MNRFNNAVQKAYIFCPFTFSLFVSFFHLLFQAAFCYALSKCITTVFDPFISAFFVHLSVPVTDYTCTPLR
jgi:hypothetical protein